jgi:hypothetical protein
LDESPKTKSRPACKKRERAWAALRNRDGLKQRLRLVGAASRQRVQGRVGELVGWTEDEELDAQRRKEQGDPEAHKNLGRDAGAMECELANGPEQRDCRRDDNKVPPASTNGRARTVSLQQGRLRWGSKCTASYGRRECAGVTGTSPSSIAAERAPLASEQSIGMAAK